MGWWSARKDSEPKLRKSGGFFFFFSLASLIFLAVVNVAALPYLFSKHSLVRVMYFGLAAFGGAFIGRYLFRFHLSVLIHELKHAIISSFAGNRARGLKIRKDSGHFEYSYTKDTAHFNALISLAPYFLPLFTAPAIALSYTFFGEHDIRALLIVGAAFGLDTMLNIRDISPHQTDLIYICGGYWIAILFIVAMNTTIGSFTLAWVFGGKAAVWSMCQTLLGMFGLILGKSDVLRELAPR